MFRLRGSKRLERDGREGTHRFDTARERMVEEQLRGRGITDLHVLAAMGKVPRHLFVEEALQERAYGDHPLPIGEGQTISQPYIVALMCETLGLRGGERVLEIGTGSGYQAAVLAELAERVYSVDRFKGISLRAREALEKLGYHNVLTRVCDGTLGWPEENLFDAIVVAAGAPALPEPLMKQLAVGGRLVIPVGDAQGQVLLRVTKGPQGLKEEKLGACVFVKLVGRYGWPE